MKTDPKILEGKVYRQLIMVAAVTFVILPFVTTFNEFLTKVVESLKFVSLIQGYVAPLIVRILAAILLVFKIPASINGSHLYMTGIWLPLRIYINWNCVGWQSFILLLFTFITGLQGPYKLRSKLLVILIGLEGSFLINIIRILIPTLLAYRYGYLPAVIFHDYLGTLLTLFWMGVFWNYAFGHVLIELSEEIEGNTIDPIVKEAVK